MEAIRPRDCERVPCRPFAVWPHPGAATIAGHAGVLVGPAWRTKHVVVVALIWIGQRRSVRIEDQEVYNIDARTVAVSANYCERVLILQASRNLAGGVFIDLYTDHCFFSRAYAA